MSFPVKTCIVCSQEFELKPDKPGFANRCPECSDPETKNTIAQGGNTPGARQAESGLNEARRQAMRNLLYRKDA